MIKVEAVILYSTNDHRFFRTCIENLLKCNIRCHVVTYSHMWNGEKENDKLLKESIELFKNNRLVNFYSIEWKEGKSPWYWEGAGRFLATQQVSESSTFVLYVDVDEIIEPEQFKNFLEMEKLPSYDAIGIYGYWYWLLPTKQATTTEYTATMVKTSLARKVPMREGGRKLYFDVATSKLIVGQTSPFVHHYSWVRTKEEMIKKVLSWGHRDDRANWVDLIEEEFKNPNTEKDFVHGYTYVEVENKFNIKI